MNIQDKDGKAPLHVAVLEFPTKNNAYLLTEGSNADTHNSTGNRPAFRSVPDYKFEILELVLNAGASFATMDCRVNTPLHYAALLRSSLVLSRLLQNQTGVDFDIRNDKDFTVLDIAACQGRIANARELVGAGADVLSIVHWAILLDRAMASPLKCDKVLCYLKAQIARRAQPNHET